MAYYNLHFEITPNLIKEDSYGRYIPVRHCGRGINAQGKLYENNKVIVLAGSILEIHIGDTKERFIELRNKYKQHISNAYFNNVEW